MNKLRRRHPGMSLAGIQIQVENLDSRFRGNDVNGDEYMS